MKYWGDGNGRDVRESLDTGDGQQGMGMLCKAFRLTTVHQLVQKAKYFQPIKLGKTISDEI